MNGCLRRLLPVLLRRLGQPPKCSNGCADLTKRSLHVTCTRPDLMEFFDSKENWGKSEVKVGRSWKRDELRLKSNEDLHKLWCPTTRKNLEISTISCPNDLYSQLRKMIYLSWNNEFLLCSFIPLCSSTMFLWILRYILLKERNMLLTMAEAYKMANEHMPNDERLDKVDESMENLEEVVRERNRAYWYLEVGESGEQERKIVDGPFGIDEGYLEREHAVSWSRNLRYQGHLRSRRRTFFHPGVLNFFRWYREKIYREIRRQRFQQLRLASNTLKRFPDCDPEALEAKYPLVKFSEVRSYYNSLGHHRNLEIDAPSRVILSGTKFDTKH